jgi:hypothetical protein
MRGLAARWPVWEVDAALDRVGDCADAHVGGKVRDDEIALTDRGDPRPEQKRRRLTGREFGAISGNCAAGRERREPDKVDEFVVACVHGGGSERGQHAPRVHRRSRPSDVGVAVDQPDRQGPAAAVFGLERRGAQRRQPALRVAGARRRELDGPKVAVEVNQREMADLGPGHVAQDLIADPWSDACRVVQLADDQRRLSVRRTRYGAGPIACLEDTDLDRSETGQRAKADHLVAWQRITAPLASRTSVASWS